MDGFLATLDQPVRLPHAPAGSARGGSPLRPQVLSSIDQGAEIATGPASRTRAQPWLPEALAELGECAEEAREEGYPEPTYKALATAGAVLKRMARLPARLPQPNVYPAADHEIDLFFRRGDVGASVLVLIDPDGGGACFSNVGGLRRARHNEINDLMIETIELELHRLSRLAALS